MKNKILIFAVSVLFYSCGRELSVSDVNINTPVVESYLRTGDGNLSVKVYSLESFDDNDAIYSNPIKGLNIYVNETLLTETTGGTYSMSLSSTVLTGGEEYNLRFEYGGRTISGSTIIPDYPMNARISQSVIYRDAYTWGYYSDTIPEVKVTWDNPDNSFYQVYVRYLDGDGSSGTGPGGRPGGGFGRMMMQPFQGNSYTLKGSDISNFGRYVLVLYKVNTDYAELYERVSSTDLANPVSFIDNALGIFTALSADTISYSVIQIEE